DTQAAPADEAPEETDVLPQAAPPPPTPPPREPARPAWWAPAWAVPIALLLGALVFAVRPWLSRWRRETPLDRAIRLSGYPVYEDLKLSPDGRRSVMVDRLIRTPSGLIALTVAELSGEIRGALDADHWLMGKTPFLNPLKRLQQATAATAHYALAVPVHARLVIRGQPKFAMPLPSSAVSVSTFARTLEEFIEPEVPTRELDSVWRTLMRMPRSNDKVLKPRGIGPGAWLRRHATALLAGSLVAVALMVAVALAMVPAV
ncbi:MAG: nuclease-related domain-containing protein, partial [Pseudomonadota bacterium]